MFYAFFKRLMYVPAFFILLALGACSKSVPIDNASDVVQSGTPAPTQANVGADAPALPAHLNREAVRYVDNIKSVLYATNAFERPDIQGSYENLMDNQENFSENPMSLKLNFLDIYDEDGGREVNFYDMPREQQEVFVDKLLEDQRNSLSEKLDSFPELAFTLKMENEATEKVLAEQQIPLRHVGDLEKNVKVGEELAKALSEALEGNKHMYLPYQRNAAQEFRAADRPALKSKEQRLALFKMLNESIAKKSENIAATQPQPQALQNQGGLVEGVPKTPEGGDEFIGIGFGWWSQRVNPEHVRNMWVSYAQRGNIVVALPIHGWSFTFLNLSKGPVGHAGIIGKKINYSQEIDRKDATIEANIHKKRGVDGVIKGNIRDYWGRKHYIMGIKRVRWRWHWNWFRSRFYKEVQYMNPAPLADWAQRYIGHQYVHWYEFLTAKWAAPSRFTCTTLIWWCAKKAYGVNVSSWYSPLVTPSGMFWDESTYLIMEVR